MFQGCLVRYTGVRRRGVALHVTCCPDSAILLSGHPPLSTICSNSSYFQIHYPLHETTYDGQSYRGRLCRGAWLPPRSPLHDNWALPVQWNLFLFSSLLFFPQLSSGVKYHRESSMEGGAQGAAKVLQTQHDGTNRKEEGADSSILQRLQGAVSELRVLRCRIGHLRTDVVPGLPQLFESKDGTRLRKPDTPPQGRGSLGVPASRQNMMDSERS